MRTYVERNLGKDYLKGMNIQEVGVYYNVPVRNIYEDKRADFEYETEDDYLLLDKYTIDSGLYLENYDDVSYEYTDFDEINDVLCSLMDYKKYNHYLGVAFHSTWNNTSSYKFFSKDEYNECFYRSYDASMYVKGSSKHGKYLQLREYHHDKPMGHDSIIIGLTDAEYEKLESKNIDEIIEYAYICLISKVDNIEF